MKSRKMTFEELDAAPKMTPTDAAKLLGTTEAQLQYLRDNNAGPRYYRIGRRTVRYLHDDLLEWFNLCAVEPTDQMPTFEAIDPSRLY